MKIPWLVTKVSLRRREGEPTVLLDSAAARLVKKLRRYSLISFTILQSPLKSKYSLLSTYFGGSYRRTYAKEAAIKAFF